MTPGSFDPTTCREMVGDERARVIEAQARADADANTYAPPTSGEKLSYWAECQLEFQRRVYINQHQRRLERNARKVTA